MTLLCSYDDTAIDEFYEKLQAKINKLPKRSNFMILGDLNAKVGNDSHKNWLLAAGKFGLRNRNNRGERLLQFCSMNNLAIVNTFYKHKEARLVTWISPDGKTKNQIDFVIVKKENLSFVKNCCVYNSADVGSDHSLLLSKFLLPIPKKRQSRTTLKRFDVDNIHSRYTDSTSCPKNQDQ